MVHELAHVWDLNQTYIAVGQGGQPNCSSCAGRLSYELAQQVQGQSRDEAGVPSNYAARNRPVPGSTGGRYEYFAESVAAYVYPDANRGDNNYAEQRNRGLWNENKTAYKYIDQQFKAFRR